MHVSIERHWLAVVRNENPDFRYANANGLISSLAEHTESLAADMAQAGMAIGLPTLNAEKTTKQAERHDRNPPRDVGEQLLAGHSMTVHHSSGTHARADDYEFRPDDDTKSKVGTESCSTEFIDGVLRIVRPASRGRYIAIVHHYAGGESIPASHVPGRCIRIAFDYATTGAAFSMLVRLRYPGGGWVKKEDGKWCERLLKLSSAEWTHVDDVRLLPVASDKPLFVSFELTNGRVGGQPGPAEALSLRNIWVWEAETV
ncbi:MAG: hypothetical protein PVJ57_06910 [Phycisphaerae bacterium]|jgi:hypothetical protein